MNQIFLDAVGAGFFAVLFLLGLLFIIIVTLLEAFIMKKLNYQPSFKKAVLHSFIVNIVSLVAGFFINFFWYELKVYSVGGFAGYFAATLIVEGFLLYLLNRQKPVTETIKTVVIMNIASYVLAGLLAWALGDFI